MSQTLGIIGSGNIGTALARLAIAGGLRVVLSNSRGPETLAALVAELGEHATAATPTEADRVGRSLPGRRRLPGRRLGPGTGLMDIARPRRQRRRY